jgi:hypothetical protein
MPIESDPSFDTVKKDVVAGFGPGFSPRQSDDDDDEPFRVNERFKGVATISNEQVVAVPWTYLAKHTGDFHCLFATGRDVQIEGMTLVDSREGSPVLHRYVDWMGLAAQLGLEVSWRIAVTEEEYAFGRDAS